MYSVFVNGFWGGFFDNDANNISYFIELFKRVFGSFEITGDINRANILFESLFSESLTNIKQWKYKIFFSGEAYDRGNVKSENYDIILSGNIYKNNIDLPLFISYIYCNNFIERLTQRKLQTKEQISKKKFCCFFVSNYCSDVRVKMFDILNCYKKVDSYAHCRNNMGEIGNYIKDNRYWSEDYFNLISEYKFIICFENTKCGTYITEKIVNAYIANTLPIYWGSDNVNKIFNEKSMITLKNDSDSYYLDVLNLVIELDNNDDKYLEYVNQPVFNKGSLENYSMDNMSQRMKSMLNIN